VSWCSFANAFLGLEIEIFTEAEENKLEYMQVFHQYSALVGKFIANGRELLVMNYEYY